MVKGRDNLISLLRETHNSTGEWHHIQALTVEAYDYLEELYIEHFGPSWFHSELGLAIRIIDKRAKIVNVQYGGRKRSQQFTTYKTIQDVIKEIFAEADKEQEAGEPKFIGTKQVTAEQFSFYSKGLYWMAGARLVS